MIKDLPAVRVGDWITYQRRGSMLVALVIEQDGKTLFQHGPRPAIGTRLIRVVWKNDKPVARGYTTYEGITK